jgi:hypothetical protein
MPNLGRLSCAVAVALGLTFSQAELAAEGASKCGAPGLPACPLQHWMRAHAAAPLAKRNLPEVVRAFERIEALNPTPDKWQNWSKIARDGAAAARDGNANRAKSACGRCHRAYRRAYNMHHRSRPISE